jgi:hypothetical protein
VAAKRNRRNKFKGIHGLTSGSKIARTAWIQYTFAPTSAAIRIYRYGWVVYDDPKIPLSKMAEAKKAAQKWAREVGFLYIRERVTMELTYELKLQDGTHVH